MNRLGERNDYWETDDYDVSIKLGNRELSVTVSFSVKKVVDFYQSARLTADPYYSEPEVEEYHNELYDDYDIENILEKDADGCFSNAISVECFSEQEKELILDACQKAVYDEVENHKWY